MLPLLSLCLLQADATFTKWDKEIAAIEAKHKDAKPGGIVFAGSSSVRLWDLKASFPERAVLNCGFGGSEIRHSTHFAKRIIVPLKPSRIIFYAGDNDIAAKRTAEQVKEDFAAFVKAVRADLPTTRIDFLSIKASVKRWDMVTVQSDANAKVKAFVQADASLGYIDTVALLLGPDGKPEAKYFAKDGLHLSEAGYKKWTAAVEAHLLSTK
jgi:lysophospholipase L1-like esterase